MPSLFSFSEEVPGSEDGMGSAKATPEGGAGAGAARLFPETGYSLWEYASEAWVLKKCHCKDGFVSGSAPAAKGKYKGEIKRKACEPGPC